MSYEFVFRIVGMLVLGAAGAYWGYDVVKFDPFVTPETAARSTITFGLVGMLTGLILTPYFTTRPVRKIQSKLATLTAENLFASLTGLVVGMLAAALLAFPLSMLPKPAGEILPFIGVLVFSYFGVTIFMMRQGDLMGLLGALGGRSEGGGSSASTWGNLNRNILLDTSVIIDGRVADIAKTGFLPGTLLIPRFVLNELQYIADSPDGMRRQRGRRGMEVLAELQKLPNVLVRISDINVEGVREVDDKLIMLGKQLKSPVLTNDYNLNRIAELQGVAVLNINELANAIKSVVLPGESLRINIMQEGKEHSQGVGYMDDGTMVVVENGKEYIGEYMEVNITKVLQTAAGRMIFGRVDEEHHHHSGGNGNGKRRR